MELMCEYDTCGLKFKGDNMGQSIDLLKMHYSVKHYRAPEMQGGGECIKKKIKVTEKNVIWSP